MKEEVKSKKPFPEMNEEEASEELQAILDALSKYVGRHKGNVCLALTIKAFEKDDKVVDSRIVVFGATSLIKIAIDDLMKHVEKYKDDFLDWRVNCK